MKKKRKKDAEFQWKREGVLGALSSGFSRSLLDDPKALKEEEAGGFIRGPERVECAVGIQIPLAGAAAAAAKVDRRRRALITSEVLLRCKRGRR